MGVLGRDVGEVMASLLRNLGGSAAFDRHAIIMQRESIEIQYIDVVAGRRQKERGTRAGGTKVH